MRIVALIIGIDGWSKYTLPLYASLQRHEPACEFVIIDNASSDPYPDLPFVHRTERLCYSKAINRAARIAGPADWYVVLSNDVLCEGPFAQVLKVEGSESVLGPLLKTVHGFPYLEGWCVVAPAQVWDTLGGWDENFQVSSWEDVDFSTRVLEHNFSLIETSDLPFVHLDQRQRFGLVADYWDSERHNIEYFMSRHQSAQQVGAL